MHFVRVNSKEKQCAVLIDMEKVFEIVPHKNGGSVLFFISPDDMGAARGALNNGRVGIHVDEEFSMFEQFIVQTVSSADVAKRVESLSKTHKEKIEIPKL